MERYARAWLDEDGLETEMRLPGISPLTEPDWLRRDEAFAYQMSVRDHLIETRRDDVLALLPSAQTAASECLSLVLETIERDEGYRINGDMVVRPDGVAVTVDRNDPLATLGRLIQADICLMQQGDAGHILAGAVLCFPASWTLSQKIGKALVPIHAPVADYDGDLARRVQRLFDAIRVGRPLTRTNALLYASDRLFHPLVEGTTHDRPTAGEGFLRSERQTLRRLPATGTVVFGIHTRIVPAQELPLVMRRALEARYPG